MGDAGRTFEYTPGPHTKIWDILGTQKKGGWIHLFHQKRMHFRCSPPSLFYIFPHAEGKVFIDLGSPRYGISKIAPVSKFRMKIESRKDWARNREALVIWKHAFDKSSNASLSIIGDITKARLLLTHVSGIALSSFRFQLKHFQCDLCGPFDENM